MFKFNKEYNKSLDIQKEKRTFNQALAFLQKRLNQANIDYRIIGSIATYSYAKDYIKQYSQEPLLPHDIDILCVDKKNNKKKLEKIEQIGEQNEQKYNIKTDHCFEEKILFHNGQVFLHYEDLKLKIPNAEKIFQPILIDQNQSIVNCSFITVPPETLFHIYNVRGRGFRKTDVRKVYGLARLIKEKPTPGLNESDYQVFHQFFKKIMRNYPISAFLAKEIKKIEQSKVSKNIHQTKNKNEAVAKLIRTSTATCRWVEKFCRKSKIINRK